MILQGIHHTTLLVSDLERARRFYESILELRPDDKRPAMKYPGVWYDVSPTQQLHLICVPGHVSPAVDPDCHPGHERHVAFMVFSFTELKKRLDQSAVPYTLSSSGRNALFCRDPDQNVLEFSGT